MNQFSAKLVRKEHLKPMICIMKFKPEKNIEFQPGQFLNLTIEKEDEELMRPYSMTNTPSEENIEFYVKAYPDGDVAQHIVEMEEGEKAKLTGPFGNFTLQDTDNEIYYIAAGSGIAPLVSMARHLKEKNSDRKQTFLHGVSYNDEFGYYKQLSNMEGENFTYIPTISRPGENPSWEGRHGRVEEYLNLCKNKQAEAYICGPPPMVEKVQQKLLKKGFKQEKIFTEQYY